MIHASIFITSSNHYAKTYEVYYIVMCTGYL